MSQDELNTVQQVFLLAAPIAVDSLSEEGALNLLIPPPAQVDANRDGLTQIGAGTTLRFPDSETPASVVAAWEDATAGMDSREKLTYVFRLKVPTFFPRPPADGSRNDGAVYPPGPPSIVDPTRQPKFSYGDLTQRALEALELFKYQTPPEQYASQKEFWTKFRDSLRAHGAS